MANLFVDPVFFFISFKIFRHFRTVTSFRKKGLFRNVGSVYEGKKDEKQQNSNHICHLP